MSIKINIQTPNKSELAQVLRSIANLIESSSNDTIIVFLEAIFNKSKKKRDC